jgi:hypothetical protein
MLPSFFSNNLISASGSDDGIDSDEPNDAPSLVIYFFIFIKNESG